jgi:hypothetical protein
MFRLPQVGSGTLFWEGAVGVADGIAQQAALASGCNTTLEKHGKGWRSPRQTHPNSAVLIPVSERIAQGTASVSTARTVPHVRPCPVRRP